MAAKVMAGVVGLHGSREKGLQYLREVGKSDCETSADARVALSLFLRRHAKYKEALEIQRTLVTQYPKNFLFALEEANLLKDVGNGPEAAAAYSRVLENARKNVYVDPHLERVTFGLAEVLKGQRQTEAALKHYQETLTVPNAQPDLRLRALLCSGQMQDVLNQRPAALESYRAVLALDGDSPQASAARRHLKEPYSYPR
jgi:tetratricopeptide (TPR) repeat protein